MPADRLLHPAQGHSRKVSALTDLEFRVWTQYLLSADDYGVMVETAAQLQADNFALARRRPGDLSRALERLVDVELLLRFEHQGQAYLCSANWQEHQAIRHHRKTYLPCPPRAVVERCEPATRAMFLRRTTAATSPPSSVISAEDVPEDFGRISESLPLHARAPVAEAEAEARAEAEAEAAADVDRQRGPVGSTAFGSRAVWDAWRGVAAEHGAPLPVDPSPRDDEHLRVLHASYALDDLLPAMRCWWASPTVDRRYLGTFRADVGDVLRHLASGRRAAYRAPPPARSAPTMRSAWRDACPHSPPCPTPERCALRGAREAEPMRTT